MKYRIVTFVVGAAAALAAGCGSERLASVGCDEDTDCAEGQVCRDGECRTPPAPECLLDSDCLAGQKCVNGACQQTAPQCLVDKHCAADERCVDGKCVNVCGPDATGCDDHNPCTQRDACRTGACVGEPLADGTSCTLPEATGRHLCVSGRCAAPVCGDGYLDRGATPPEECDDGNLRPADGCESDCTLPAPVLTITSPERGATLDGPSAITVRGTATDVFHGVQSVRVNGQAASLGTDGTWTYALTAQHGLNALEVTATNAKGKTSRRTVGFYHSAAYRPYATPVGSTPMLEGGRVLHLSQEAIDDGDHPCSQQASGYACTQVDDLATVGEVTLNNFDFKKNVGSLPLYERTRSFLAKSYDFTCTDCGISGLVVGAKLKLTGDVVIQSRLTGLDFNALKLALTSRAGGLDGLVTVTETGTAPNAVPGLRMTVHSIVAVPVRAAFDKSTIQLRYGSYNAAPLMCDAMFDETVSDWTHYFCPHGAANDVDPLASLNPGAQTDSSLTVASMSMDSQFDLTLSPNGGVQVTLVAGQLDFLGSNIELDPLRNATIDLGNLTVFNTAVPLGSYPLRDLTGDLDGMVRELGSVLLTGLQTLLADELEKRLLDPSDPLSVGELIKTAIDSMAPRGPVALAPFAGQAAAPAVTLETEIASVACAAPTRGPLTGGITLGLDARFTSEKKVQRSPLGSVLAAGCYGTPAPALAFPMTAALEDAEHVDAVNQALFAAWWNGGLDLRFDKSHLSQTLPASLASVTAFTVTPQLYTAPILSNCGGEALTLQFADARVVGDVTTGGVRSGFEAFVSGKVPVRVAVVGGKPVLEKVALPGKFVVELVSTPALSPDAAATVEALLNRVLVDEVLLRYGGQVLAAVPEFKLDLNAIAPVSNAAVLRIAPQSAQTAAGYTVLGGPATP